MRPEPIDIDLAGTRLQIVCDDPSVATALRQVLRDHLVSEPSPTAFVLRTPNGQTNLHTLLDRSGFVLARGRSAADCATSLLGHLAAWLPLSTTTTHLRLRAFLTDDSTAILAVPPLFVDLPPVERRLQREGVRMLDRLAVEFTSDGAVQVDPWPWSWQAIEPVGHAASQGGKFEVKALLVPQVGSDVWTRGMIVALLASLGSPHHAKSERLAIAERLAAKPMRVVGLEDRSARYAALSL